MKTGICIIVAMLCAEVGQAGNKNFNFYNDYNDNDASRYTQYVTGRFPGTERPWCMNVIKNLSDVFYKKSRYGGKEYNTIDLSYDRLISYTIENWSFLPDSVKEKVRLLALEKDQFKKIAIPEDIYDTKSIFVFDESEKNVNRIKFAKCFLERLLDNPLGEARIKSILLVSYLQEALDEKALLRNKTFLEYNKVFNEKQNRKIKIKFDLEKRHGPITSTVYNSSGELTLTITGCFGPRLPQVLVYREGQTKREKEKRCKDNVKYSYILRIIRDYGCLSSNKINSYLKNSKVTEELSSKLINSYFNKNLRNHRINKEPLTLEEEMFDEELEKFVQDVTKEIVSEGIKDEDIREAFDKFVVTYIHELSHCYHGFVGFFPQFEEPQSIEYDKEVLQYCVPCLNEAVKREIENNEELEYNNVYDHQKGLKGVDGSLYHSGFWGNDDEPLTELGFTFRYDRNERHVYIIEDRINENMARLQCNMPYEVAHGSLGTPQPVEDALNVDGDGSYKNLLNEFYKVRNVDQNYVQLCNEKLQEMF